MGGLPHEQCAWPLIGRADALADAVRALVGDAGAVVVAGSAGVGKTRFARAVLDSARAQDMAVEWTMAARGAATIPLGAFAHLVDGSRWADVPDPLARYGLVVAALQRRAGHRRLIVAVDDAHLLDPVSAAFLVRAHAAGLAAVVVTLRSDERCPEPVRALWKDGGALRVDLEELNADQTGAVLVAVLGAPVEDTTCRRVGAATRGNPLLLRELVHDGLETGALRPVAGQWRWNDRIGPSGRLRDVTEARLAELTPPARRGVELLALGGPLGCSLVHALAGDAVVAELSRRSLVTLVRTGRRLEVGLAHPLDGAVVRAVLPAVVQDDRRGALLEATATRGMRRHDDLLCCMRWRLDRDGTAPAGLLTAAAQLTPDPGLRLRLMKAAAGPAEGHSTAQRAVLLARAFREHNRFADAGAALATVHERALDARGRAELAAEWAALLHHGLGRSTDAEAVVARATADGLDHPLLEATDMALRYRRGDLTTVADAGLRLVGSPRRGDPRAVVLAGMALVHTGRTEQARAFAERARTRTQGQAVRTVEGARIVTAWALLHEGRLAEAERVISDLHEQATHREDPASLGPATTLRGRLALLRGAVGSARRWLIEASGHLETSDLWALLPTCLAALAQSAALSGDLDGARAWCDAAAASPRPAGLSDASLAVAEIRVAVATGELHRGRALAMDTTERCGEDVVSEARVLHEGLRVGCPPRAAAARLRVLAEVVGGRLVTAYADHADALARGDGNALDQVSRDFADMGARLFAAECAVEAASAHRSAGRRGGALSSAARSTVLVEGCVGLDPRCLPPTGALPLSRREHDIVALAIRGLSNRQIATALTVSVRTVESHLYHAYAKLGVTRRTELPAVLA